MTQGLSHITLIVQNLKRSAELFAAVFGATEVYSSEDRTFSLSPEKFFLVHDVWFALMEGPPIARSYNHIALKVTEKELTEYRQKITDLGLEILPGRARQSGEGQSLYFYDDDNHLFELHTGTLEDRLKLYSQE